MCSTLILPCHRRGTTRQSTRTLRDKAAQRRSRVKAGATPYAAAKAEGIALSTIYRAVRKPGETDYAYDVGAALGAICDRYGDKITATAMGNIAGRPDLILSYLRHLDLSEFDIPAKPAGWRPGAPSSSFWLGYYHGRTNGR